MKKVLAITVAVLMLALSALPVFAESIDSPKATTANYIIKFPGDDDIVGGRAVAEFVTGVGEDGSQTVVISGIPDEGYAFTGWTLDGNYEIVEGDLTSAVIKLIIFSDINATPQFTKNGEPVPATTQAADKQVDNGDKSPKTGSNDILAYTLIALSVIGCGAASVALVKTAKKN